MRTRVLGVTLLALLGAGLVGGCAKEDDADWMQVRSLECYPCRATKQGVTLAVECWSSGEQRRRLFRGDPGQEVLPVRFKDPTLGNAVLASLFDWRDRQAGEQTPVDRDEVYKEIFEQAENFKTYQAS